MNKKNDIFSKVMVALTFIICIGLIAGTTSYKVIKKHNDNLLLVSKKYIIEKTKQCYNDKVCSGNSVSLKNLYEHSYLDRQANPVTKEYYNEASYIVKLEDNTYNFIIVN